MAHRRRRRRGEGRERGDAHARVQRARRITDLRSGRDGRVHWFRLEDPRLMETDLGKAWLSRYDTKPDLDEPDPTALMARNPIAACGAEASRL